MSVHGNSTDAQNAAELQDMVPTAGHDLSDPNAPLLVPADASSDHGANGNIVTSELSYAGGWFIWILTFSAGISGLLFGYEYASILSPVYVSREANEPDNSQHRRDIIHSRNRRLRPVQSAVDNPRREPNHIQHQFICVAGEPLHRDPS